MSLPREILKWIQGLDLSYSVKNPKRDFSNGFLLAEILSRYWREVPLHSFDTGSSLLKKADNWQTLEKVLKRRGFQLSREVMDSVMHQKNGHLVPLLEEIYTFLTKREIQNFPGMEHEEVPKPEFSPLVITRTMDSPPASALHGLQPLNVTPSGSADGGLKAPKPKPMQASLTADATGLQNVKFTEVTVKAVDNIALLRGMRSDAGIGASVLSDPSVGLTTPFGVPVLDSLPAAPYGSVQQLMSAQCRDAFRASAAATLTADAAPAGLPSIHRFINRQDNLGADMKGYVWTALGKKAATIATCIEEDPEEHIAFLCCFDPIFTLLSPHDDDWLQAQGLIIKVAQELSAHDSTLAIRLGLDGLLSVHAAHLRSGRMAVPHREGILRLLRAYIASADATAKLEFFRQLQTMLLASPAGGVRRARSADTTTFLSCLSFLASLEDSVPEQVGDFCVYHALKGLKMSSPSARAAALAILTSLASCGLVAQVMKVLPQVSAVASRLDIEAWEVTAQLAVLCGALLDAVLPALSRSGTPRTASTPPLSRADSRAEIQAIHEICVKGASGFTPVLMAAHARAVYQLLLLVLQPHSPIPARKVALVALAPRVTFQPHEYLIHDKVLHTSFLGHYMRLLLSLPASARQALLDRDGATQTIEGAIRGYAITPISTVWDPLAAATALSDIIQAGHTAVGTPPRELQDVMEVFALGVLSPNFADDQNRSQWWGLLKCVEKDIYAMLTAAAGGANTEFHELLVHIVTKFYLELGSPDLEPNATLETVQQGALHWFRARH
eukprot:GGOE01018571.1.p1 GENE.GGOE01018571.1~~GGOE01018571.1.p1  ORF type:complete len:785 (+),score=214.74 GGOE01018571.1:81-2435(+)